MSVKRGVGVSVGASRGRARVLSFFLKNTVLRLRLTVGSLSNYEDDHNDDFKKTRGLMIKTTALQVHNAFEYISLTSTARL